MCETLIPNKKYLEIFGRSANCRSSWVTVGNQLGEALRTRANRDGLERLYKKRDTKLARGAVKGTDVSKVTQLSKGPLLQLTRRS